MEVEIARHAQQDGGESIEVDEPPKFGIQVAFPVP